MADDSLVAGLSTSLPDAVKDHFIGLLRTAADSARGPWTVVVIKRGSQPKADAIVSLTDRVFSSKDAQLLMQGLSVAFFQEDDNLIRVEFHDQLGTGLRKSPHELSQEEESVVREFRQFLDRVRAGRRPQERSWMGSIELLIQRLDKLLEDRDRLETDLVAALGDLEVAQARIRELEQLKDVVATEAYRTKDHINKDFIGKIAVALVAVMGTISVALIQHDKPSAVPVKDTIEVAKQVVVNCGNATATAGVEMVKPPHHGTQQLPGTG